MLFNMSPLLGFTPLTTISMDPIPLESMGFATSLFSLARNMGSSMGISFVTTAIARRSQFHQARLVEGITAYSPGVQQAMHSLGNMMGGGDHSRGALTVMYGQVLRQASAISFLEMFHVLGVLFLVTLPLVWTMRRPRHHSQRPPVPSGGAIRVKPDPTKPASAAGNVEPV